MSNAFFRRRPRPRLWSEAGLAKLLVTLSLACALGLAAMPTRGVDRKWVGQDDANWSAPGSWSPAGAPQSGDILHFSGSGATVNMDVPTATVAGMSFEGGDYAIGQAPPIGNPNADPQYGQIIVAGPVGQPGWITNCGGSGRSVSVNIQTLSFPNGGYIASGAGDDANVIGSSSINLNINCELYVANQVELHARTHVFEQYLETQVDGGVITFNGVDFQSFERFDFGTVDGPGSVLAVCDYGSKVWLAGPPYENQGGLIVQTQNGAMVNLAMSYGSPSNYSLTIDNASVVTLSAPGQVQNTAVSLFAGAKLSVAPGCNSYLGSLTMVDYIDDAYPCIVDSGTSVLALQNGLYSASDNETVYPLIKGTLDLGTNDVFRTFDTEGSAYYTLDIQANMTGNGFVKTGPAALLLDASNSFFSTVITEGIVEARNDFAFGTPNALWGVNLAGGGIILDNMAVRNQPLIVASELLDNQGLAIVTNTISTVVTHGVCSWSGPITVNDSYATFGGNITADDSLTIYSDSDFQISGPLQGAGNLTLLGETIGLSGNSPNTLSGTTFAGCALLTFDKLASGGANALSGPLVIGSQGGLPAEVRWLNDFQIFCGQFHYVVFV